MRNKNDIGIPPNIEGKEILINRDSLTNSSGSATMGIQGKGMSFLSKVLLVKST